MDIEKLEPAAESSSRPTDNFNAFLQTAISAILAFVFSLRLILFTTFTKRLKNEEESLEEASDSHSSSPDFEFLESQTPDIENAMAEKQKPPGMPSVMSLLQTDEMPSSCSDDEPSTSAHIPLPSLLQSNMSSLPNFLHTINEEESDEVRSVSTSSLASPRTVVDRRLSNISLLSPTPEDSFPEDQVAESDVEVEQSPEIDPETTHIETQQRVLREIEITQSHSEDDRLDLLKELAKIGKTSSGQMLPLQSTAEFEPFPEVAVPTSEQPQQIASELFQELEYTPAPAPVLAHVPATAPAPAPALSSETQIELVQQEQSEEERPEESEPQQAELVSVPLTHSEPEDHRLADADRDQEEELVFNEERRKTVTMDDTSSLRSTSITLDTTREELQFNESIASNPHDETILMQSTKDEHAAASGHQIHHSDRPRSPLDLPPPPSSVVAPLPPPPPIPSQTTQSNITKSSSSHYSTSHWTSDGANTRISPTSLIGAQPPPSVLHTKTTSSAYPLYTSASSAMSVPTEAPPPLPSTTSAYQHHTTSTNISSIPKSIHSSREDLLSEHATSRSTVREIPVQRAPSTAPSHSSVFDYRVMPSTTTTYHHVETPSDEYYRREVMTRTIITRSTEALSQLQPPLGRSSPVDRYLPYTTTTTSADGRTREERTVDYKVTYHRDIEEEERRIRDEQDRRRQEEENRRIREEESRRQWELMEKETLDRLRDQQNQAERQLERSLAEHERIEKERIERDRTERQRMELIRRAEWERIEKDRIDAEETELARRRLLEKEKIEREKAEEERKTRERLQRERERLERERLEAERKEKERFERERIERERIERERIEIERIERIKRERIEKEKRDREKEKEEEERLKREREELERLERERRELEIRERQELELQRREAEERERQRLEDHAREVRRIEEEKREAELLAEVQRQAEERERARRRQEREEHERMERIRLEQQRIDAERADADRRERERKEEERRERELLEAARRNKEARDRERMEELEQERLREEEERRERERREQERRQAAERERQRREEEEREMARLNELQRSAAMRKAQRDAETDRQRERDELDRKARQISEMEIREKERRERERLQEEAQVAELKDKERRNQEIRERERREAMDRENARRLDDRRSRDKLDILVRERSEKEKFEAEKRRFLAEKEAINKKKHHLLSSETLAKLTQPSYFSREPASEITTKVERQIIERVDRNLWVEDIPYSSNQQAISYSLDSTNDENVRDRIYNPHDLSRNGSSRNRMIHRARMDKARRDFYSSPQDSADPAHDRFRKSTEELSIRSRPEFRGPLLQKFHESEFRSTHETDGLPYRRMGPSPYEKPFAQLLEETERKYAAYHSRASNPSLYQSSARNYSTHYLDSRGAPRDAHNRAESVVAYERESRRESPADVAHIRSRSADYLMDRKIREETEVPENQLQKTMGENSPRESRISEHELRFRKSTEKLTVPDWYRENVPTTTSTSAYRTYTTATTSSGNQYQTTHAEVPSSAGGNIDLPKGMFDKYRDEIEDLRRSRSALNQIGQDPRQGSALSVVADQGHALPGYIVSEVPNAWNMQTSRTSRVVEVADTFADHTEYSHEYGNFTSRYGGRVTIEEVLDSIFQKVSPSDQRRFVDTSYPQADDLYQGNLDGPGIYTNNYSVMHQVIKQPERAESLLKGEELYVRCAQCHRTRELSAARLQFVSCKHCYTYYCSRECRQHNWQHHSGRCSFARINTLCKDVIMKVREDQEAQSYMSKVALDGYSSSGRGSVNIRLSSPQLAQAYVSHGWRALSAIPLSELLYYYTVAALVQEKKEQSLISLCRRYKPREKFILSVSIIADIEHCPETPPPETREMSGQSSMSRFPSIQHTSIFPDIPPVHV